MKILKEEMKIEKEDIEKESCSMEIVRIIFLSIGFIKKKVRGDIGSLES